MLFFDMYHGISDGTGMYNVLRTLLYYYCKEKYDPEMTPGDIRVLGDEIGPEETADPIELLPEIDLSNLSIPERKPVFHLLRDGGQKLTGRYLFDIVIPESSLMRFSSLNDASPGTLVSLFLARAIDAVHPVRELPISSGYVINGRPMLGNPRSPANCVTTANLEYKDRMRSLDLTTQATIYRGMTFLQSDEERVRQSFTFQANRYRMMRSLPSITRRFDLCAQSMGQAQEFYTFMVSYVGKGNFGGAERYMQSFWTHVPGSVSLLIEIAAINGSIFLSLHQQFESEVYVDAFLGQFRDNGIPAELVRRSEGKRAGMIDLRTL